MSLKKMYCKNSFDRFGDDLCELILSYLSLSDCFVLQCVNKQFKHLIFNKQTKLRLTIHNHHLCKNSVIDKLMTLGNNTSVVKKDLLIYVLTKCLNISDISFTGHFIINEKLFNIISNKCKQIKHLDLSAFIQTINNTQITSKFWEIFAENCLKHLEKLTFNDFRRYNTGVDIDVITMLFYTPKLKSIYYPNYNKKSNHLFDECFRLNKQQLLNNIECVLNYELRDESFKSFAEYFAHRLKSLHVYTSNKKVNMDILKPLADLIKLEYLVCDFWSSFDQHVINILKPIGLKCLKLRELSIFYFMNLAFYSEFENGFKSLEKLSIRRLYVVSENIALLKHCVKLKHLKFIIKEINKNNFNDIHLYLPQLQSIYIILQESDKTENAIKLMQYLSKLPNLHSFKIQVSKLAHFKSAHFIRFIDSCLNIRRIGIIINFYDSQKFDIKPIEEHINRNNIRIGVTNILK